MAFKGNPVPAPTEPPGAKPERWNWCFGASPDEGGASSTQHHLTSSWLLTIRNHSANQQKNKKLPLDVFCVVADKSGDSPSFTKPPALSKPPLATFPSFCSNP